MPTANPYSEKENDVTEKSIWIYSYVIRGVGDIWKGCVWDGILEKRAPLRGFEWQRVKSEIVNEPEELSNNFIMEVKFLHKI